MKVLLQQVRSNGGSWHTVWLWFDVAAVSHTIPAPASNGQLACRHKDILVPAAPHQAWASIDTSIVLERFHDLFCKERIFSTVPTLFSLAPGVVSTHGNLQHRTHQRNGILIAVHSNDLIGHHWSCEKMLSAFPLKEGKTANMLIASRSTSMVAFVPSADRIGHSADTDQRKLSAGHRCLCLPDHRKRRTGRTHQRTQCRWLR